MARNYANIWTAIWRDEDFIALTPTAQRTYLMLFSQPDISAVGVLSLNLTRWARKAKGTTVQSLRADLMELHKAKFVAVDESTEELLVRTFVKWDRGYNNPKRQPVIRAAVEEFESPTLRAIVVAELSKLGFPFDPPPKKPSKRGAEPEPDPESAFSQVNSLSDTQSSAYEEPNTEGDDRESPEDRVVVTQGLYLEATHNPQTTTPLRDDSTAEAGETATVTVLPSVKPETKNQRANRLARIYYDIVKTTKFMAVVEVVKKAIDGGYSDGQITAGLLAFAAEPTRILTANGLRQAMNGVPVRSYTERRACGNEPYRNPVRQDAYDGWTEGPRSA